MSAEEHAQGTASPSPQQYIPPRPGEPPRAYGALIAYALMPLATRSHSTLATQLGVARTTIYRYAKDNDWAARLEPWDRRQLVITTNAAREQVDELTEEVRALRQQVADVKAYAARAKASADLALSLGLTIGQKLLRRLQAITDEEVSKMTPRDLAALAALVPRLSESGLIALGELHGAHEYLAFLAEQAKAGAPAPPALDEAEA